MSKGTKNGRNSGIPVLVIFMIIGFAMAIGGIVMTVDRKQKNSYYGTATGKITDVQHHTDSDGDDMYAAVYTYYVDDIEYTFTDDTSSSVRPSIGKRVDIRYNPEHPEIAYVGGRVWMGVILLGMGILFVLAATLGFINGGDGPQTAGRKLAGGLLLGFIVSAMGWGILLIMGDDVRVMSIPGIVLCLFGIMGIAAMVKSVKDYIAVKTGKAPEEPAHSRPSQYQYEANVRKTMSWDGNGAVQSPQNPYSGQMGGQTASYQNDQYQDASYQNGQYQDALYQNAPYQDGAYQNSQYQDNPVTDFYREHKEGIDTTIRTVQKGSNIMGNIVMIVVGGMFTFSSLLMIGGNILVLMANNDSGMVSLPAYIMPIAMEGIFLAVGIFVIVKGIKGLLGK